MYEEGGYGADCAGKSVNVCIGSERYITMSDAGILIQVIASSVSFIGIILGFIFAWMENKRSRYIEIITNQTIKNMLFLRENAALFSALTRPEIIKDAKKDIKNYKFQLIHAATNIEAIMKYRFDKERDMINIVRRTTKLCLNYYDKQTNEVKQEILILNEKFYELMSVYDYSDWQYIKAQARTRPYKEFPDFDNIYDNQKELFDNSEKPVRW